MQKDLKGQEWNLFKLFAETQQYQANYQHQMLGHQDWAYEQLREKL